MSECRGGDCTHPSCIKSPQYGTSMHFPDCIDRTCTGCLPPTADELRQRLADELRDPIVKYDGNSQPVRASQVGNRAERRAAARAARRGGWTR